MLRGKFLSSGREETRKEISPNVVSFFLFYIFGHEGNITFIFFFEREWVSEIKAFGGAAFRCVKMREKNHSKLTLNSEKSTLISLREGCCCDDEEEDGATALLAAWRPVIEEEPTSSIFLQIPSSFVAFDVLVVVGGNTEMRETQILQIS
jgi:hypothetical protein